MESSEKGVRRRKRIEEPPENLDEATLTDLVEKSAAVCPECGSIDTRRSRSSKEDPALPLKGTLFRCRQCKSHFRIRGERGRAVVILGSMGAGLIVLLIFILLASYREQWEQALNGIHISLPSFSKADPATQPAIQTRAKPVAAKGSAPSDGPASGISPELETTVRNLYSRARKMELEFPQLNTFFNDVPGQYKSALELERKSQDNPFGGPARGSGPTPRQLEDKLEQLHENVGRVGAVFRNDSAATIAAMEKITEACSKPLPRGNRTPAQTQDCINFQENLNAFRGRVSSAAEGLDLAEKNYQKTRQSLTEIKAAGTKPR